MTLFARVFMLATLACWNPAACLSQSPGPPTLESLIADSESKDPASFPDSKTTDAGPKRPAGTVARPKDGVRHPDLDKAWTEHDAAVDRAVALIKVAIEKQFDAATTKGDLAAAEKWQAMGEKFKTAGEVPTNIETKAAVSAAVADCKKAKEKLTKAYEAVVTSLTMAKKIAEARASQEELSQITLSQVGRLANDAISPVEAEALSSRALTLAMSEWEKLPGLVFQVSANPRTPCDTGITLTASDKVLLLPCSVDRWNSRPELLGDVDFRGHESYKGRTRNGMPYMRLCYMIDDGDPIYVLDSPVVKGIRGKLRFVPSDFVSDGKHENNRGRVRVKVVPVE